MASRAEILGFIASHEGLEKTLTRFPDWDRDKLRALLREAAILFQAEDQGASSEGAPAFPPPPRPAAPPAASSAPPRAPRAAAPRERTSTPTAPSAAPSPAEPVAPEASAPSAAAPSDETATAAGAAAVRRLRIYSDGAARGNPGPAGAGAVITKTDGTVVAKLGKYLGTQTNNFAEYHGLLLVLEAALRLGANEIEIYADSELLIRQLEGRYKVKSATLRPLFQQVQAQLTRFRIVRLQHVPREQNKLADEMSNRAIDERL